VSVEANFGELASYTLSKRVQYDLDDLSAANLTIYGTPTVEIQGDVLLRALEQVKGAFETIRL
jgi:hypothetical protein